VRDDVDAVDRRRAVIRSNRGGQYLDGRGLARSVRAEQGGDGASGDDEIEPVEGVHRAGAAGE